MPRTKEEIAKTIAWQIPPAVYVNLGIGIPTLVARHIPFEREIILHSENGILGVTAPPPEGEGDMDLIDASKTFVTIGPGASFFDHADSFAMLRGGNVDLGIMGAYEVSSAGDLANWSLGDTGVPGVGGAMDVAHGVKSVWVAMNHTTKSGNPKLVEKCAYPVTALGVVDRIYTDLATIHVVHDAFVVTELAPGVVLDEVIKATAARLEVDDRVLSKPDHYTPEEIRSRQDLP